MITENYIRADDGRLYHVIVYPETDTRVEIPIRNDGTVRWYKDRLKTENCTE